MAVASRIGPYTIIRHIKRGGQGRVYLGYDQRLRRQVAIKVCSLPSSWRARRKVLQEAQRAASVQSPRVVQIYDVIQSRNHLAIVMEYVSGCDLEELLAKTQLSLASILTIGRDLAVALAAARQQQVVHGDLKAANVLITDRGRVKLTDFGVARPAFEASAKPQGCSLEAVSPEQFRGEPLDVRSDLFALGCLLYRMLSGMRPFHRSAGFDAGLLLEEDPSPLRDLIPTDMEMPAELDQLVKELLQKSRADRPADTHRVRRLLSAAQRHLPLAVSGDLLREASPCFRAESLDDVPPIIPKGLGAKGRSRLAPPHWWSWFIGQPMGARFAMFSLLLVGLGLPLGYVLHQPPLAVHFSQPAISVVNTDILPPEVSALWLVTQARLALEVANPELRMSGAAPITKVYSDALRKDARPAERLRINLQCGEVLCVLGLVRENNGSVAYEQAFMVADIPLVHWQEVVKEKTLALFD